MCTGNGLSRCLLYDTRTLSRLFLQRRFRLSHCSTHPPKCSRLLSSCTLARMMHWSVCRIGRYTGMPQVTRCLLLQWTCTRLRWQQLLSLLQHLCMLQNSMCSRMTVEIDCTLHCSGKGQHRTRLRPRRNCLPPTHLDRCMHRSLCHPHTNPR